MSFFVLSIATFVLCGVLFWLAERRWPARPRRPLAAALAQDLPFVLLSNALPGYLVGVLGAGLHAEGPLHGVPAWAQWLAVLAVTEATFYGLHRAFHTVPALWPLHAPHHAVVQMDWVAGFRKHAAEGLLHGLLPLPILWALAPSPAVLLFQTLFGVVFTGFTHWNTTLGLGRLDALLVTPRVHAWHHGAELGDQRRNLAGKLPVFDRIFGSWNGTPDWPPALGLEDAARGDEGWLVAHRLRRPLSRRSR